MTLEHDPFDPTAETRRAEAAEKERLARERKAREFKLLMSMREGRNLMWELLSDAGVFQSSYRGDGATEFREGQRNVGLRYLKMLHDICPEHYITMLQEQREDDDG